MPDKFDETEAAKTFLRRIAEGERDVFWQIWSHYRDYLHRICLLQMQGNPADAEDALSEIMLKALNKLPQHAAKIANLPAWLARLARNHCIDIHRSRSRRSDLDPSQVTQRAMTRSEEFNGEEHRLSHAPGKLTLHQLTPVLHKTFVARFVKEKSYSEIAQSLGISPACARKRIQRALEIIRRQLPSGANMAAFSMHISRQEPAPPHQQVEGHIFSPASGAAKRLALVTIQISDGREEDFPIESYSRRAGLGNLQRYIQKHPRGWKKRLQLARHFFLAGQWDLAREEFEYVLGRHSSRKIWIELGDLHRYSDRLADARTAYNQALLCRNQAFDDRYVYALIALSDRMPERAADLLQQLAQEQSPQEPAVEYTLLRLQHEMERPLDLLATCEAVLARRPADCVALAYRSIALAMLGNHGAACESAQGALKMSPDNPLLLQCAVRSHCEMQQIQGRGRPQVRTWLRKLFKLFPQAASTHEALAHYHIAGGDWEAGVRILHAFVTQQPRHIQGWLNLATWLYRTGNLVGAVDAVSTACALSDENFHVLRSACEILSDARMEEDIVPAVNRMLACPTQNWTKWSVAAEVLARLPGERDRALVLSRRACQLQPRLSDVWWRHGEVLRKTGNLEQAIAAFQQARNLAKPCSNELLLGRIHVALGEVYQALENPMAASEWFERATVILKHFRTDTAETRYLLGLAFLHIGDITSGLQELQKALQHRPYYPLRKEIEAAIRIHQTNLELPVSTTSRHLPDQFVNQASSVDANGLSRKCG